MARCSLQAQPLLATMIWLEPFMISALKPTQKQLSLTNHQSIQVGTLCVALGKMQCRSCEVICQFGTFGQEVRMQHLMFESQTQKLNPTEGEQLQNVWKQMKGPKRQSIWKLVWQMDNILRHWSSLWMGFLGRKQKLSRSTWQQNLQPNGRENVQRHALLFGLDCR